ncbi:GAF domain-containing sensor histidine kinase [Oculatella sp. LEGE 06141]|uniref:GAF domain-containing sensor histidine kinase n=1 Tax=Oculatella sp. LEGE 06141 TaxID=1828648 RepID=UPI0018810DB0|nr:GAF domain-containing protein [Oculatella sp. LEGE 06141]MBE9177646.1 GAF domain-containing sensor histidine kinase [Oculatella sp. LEGE 06141]
MRDLDQRIKAAQAQLDDVSRSIGNSITSEPEPLAIALTDLITALTELQAIKTELHQKDKALELSHQAIAQGQQQLEQIHLLNASVRQMRQAVRPQAVLDYAAMAIQKLLQLDRVVVYHLIADGTGVVVAEAVQPAWDSMVGSTSSIALFQDSFWLHGHDRVQAVDSLSLVESLPEMATLLRQQQVQSSLISPLFLEHDLWGVVCGQQCSQSRHWQPFELELLQQFVQEVAIALQNAERYETAQQVNVDLEQQVHQRTVLVQRALDFESMLKRITDKVRDSLDENQILQAAVQELALVLELSGCNAALYDLKQGISVVRYEYAHSVPAYCGRVAHMDRFPRIYSQLQQGLSFQFCSLIPNPERGRVALLACPIFVDAHSSQGIKPGVLGDLWLIHNPEHIFSEFEIRLVQQVANQCAIAIRQAQLYQAAQVQVQELAKLNRLKDEFLSTVSHELRTPITNVKMAIQMLKVASDAEKQQKYLAILERESTREAELINDLLDLQRLEAASFPVALESIQLANLLSNLVEPFQSRIATQQQTLRLMCPDNLPPVVSDFTILRRILTELLNNACKYTDRGGQIQLEAQFEASSQEFGASPAHIVTVRNQAEISAAELPKIFEKFYRCSHADPWSHGGTGLGLALVQRLVDQVDGIIRVESLDGWTTFTVALPKQRLP